MDNIYYKTLQNGLTLCFIKKSGYLKKRALFAVRCGAEDEYFITPAGNCRVPYGTAHFLEHSLFEKENGSITAEFAALGAKVNAYTSLSTTAFYFDCDQSFDSCLALLAKAVTLPYFTGDNIAKEVKIIKNEAEMYQSSAPYTAMRKMLCGLYGDSALSHPITGDAEDITHIMPEILRIFYGSFYTGGRAMLTASGDMNENYFFELAEKHFTLPSDENIKTKFKLSDRVCQNRTEKRLDISVPCFCIGFRENSSLSASERIVLSDIILDMLCGRGSRVYEKLYLSGLCAAPLSASYICGKSYGVSVISGTARDPYRLLDIISDEIKKLKLYGIPQKYAERIISKHKQRLLLDTENVDSCCMLSANYFVNSLKILDILNIYDKIDISVLFKRLTEHFTTENMCISTIVPK